MSDNINKQDQAMALRKQVHAIQNEKGHAHHATRSKLPPRSELHKRRKKKKMFTFPLVRILLILFFLLIATLLTSPYWLF